VPRRVRTLATRSMLAEQNGGISAGAAAMVRLLETDHLNDQLAALAWLRRQGLVRPDRIVVAGNSFGGIETVLGAELANYCAAIDFGGGCPKLGAVARIATANDSCGSKCWTPLFFFSNRERR